MKNSIYIISILASLTFYGQTTPNTDKNYILTTFYQTPLSQTEVESLPNTVLENNLKIESITYFDDLGRPSQSNGIRASANSIDIVTPIEYDEFGRQLKDYLPFPQTNNYGGFVNNPLPIQEGYYSTNFPQDIYGASPYNTFGEKRLENSPLGKVLEQGAPGDDWKIIANNDTDHTIKYAYRSNQESVYFFKVEFNANYESPSLSLNSPVVWPANQLYVTETKDENWQPSNGQFGKTLEFKNKLGQVILKRISVFDSTKGLEDFNYHDTYYIYDDFGNLTYVLSPEGSSKIISGGTLATNAQEILNEYGYQYKYDHRNRLVEKKIPGKGWEYIVYNKLNQVVFTQDEEQRVNNNNEWNFTKYDAFGRVIMTGLRWGSEDRLALQSWMNNFSQPYETRSTTASTVMGINFFYTNNIIPNSNSYHILTINYYDDYVDQIIPSTSSYQVPIITTPKGLPTLNLVRVIGENDWINNLTCYDVKGRVIHTKSTNEYLNSIDITHFEIDFTGKTTESYSAHYKDGFDGILYYDYFSYDHMGRLISHKQKINDEKVQLIAYNIYDELGQLIRKDVGGISILGGYTKLIGVDVAQDGTITKSTNDVGWSSLALARGVIPSQFEGGTETIVNQANRPIRIGLLKTTASNPDLEYIDYGFELTSTGGVKLIISGIAQPPLSNVTYQQGDLFRVSREQTAPNSGNFVINYYHGNNILHTSSVLSQAEEDEAYTAKVAFYGNLGSSVFNFNIFGPILDKKLQKIDYKYNIRGWLTEINDIESTTHGLDEYSDLFKFRINYNHLENGTTGVPLYNGIISQTFWKTENSNKDVRGYQYLYDNLNRITAASGYKGTTIGALSTNLAHDLGGLTYDKNGNILSLMRNGSNSLESNNGVWDNLTYQYDEATGNKLINVIENSSDVNYKAFGFFDGNVNPNIDDYDYDLNGNMTHDRNKGIYNISYNHLNLPESVNITSTNGNGTGTITYVYDANGVKLKKILNDTTGNVETEYVGNFIYSDASGDLLLEFINQPEGYIIPTPIIPEGGSGGAVKSFDDDTGEITYSLFAYVFQYKDHLGNIRLSYSDTNGNGTIETGSSNSEIIEENNYYPFGLRHKGYNNVVNGTHHPYTFGGKEEQEELGLNWLDFSTRNYDAALGRWMNIDPLADKRDWLTPYNFVQNSPMFRIDPDGLTDFKVNKETGDVTRVGDVNDEPDRILKTDNEGNVKKKGEGFLGFLVKKSERGKAKVAIDDISKGIIPEDGFNLKENDHTFQVNQEGQPGLNDVAKFVSEFSDHVEKEISGIMMGKPDSPTVLRVKTHKYKGNTATNAETPVSWLTSGLNFLKRHFHTHPNHSHTPSDDDKQVKRDFPDIKHSIISGGTEEEY